MASSRRAAICIPVRTSTVVRPRVLLFGKPRSAHSTVRPVGGRLKRLVCASSGAARTPSLSRLPHDNAYRRAAGVLRDGGGVWQFDGSSPATST
uniref:Uncharacterized protein n=1 Tax=Emiliania huxleyi (strain CCMP1516) TaxID=280463 RepID=A0A0D3JKB8_EMIH1